MNFKFSRLMALSAVAAIVTVGFQSCSSEEENLDPVSVKTRAVVTIPANTVISSNTTWSSANEYLLQGKVWVSGATLTIQAGTLIRGAFNSNPVNASALVITRTGRIEAEGTATNPIVMTAEANHQEKGGWGGLVILGNAQINQSPNQQIEGISTGVVPTGVNATYGTNNAGNNDEDSGTLRYVRVEYAGASIAEANELNAFTFGGVGSGTVVDHCQAYYGADDAFEFFGGRVNARYLVATACDDDAFDFDFGYQGKIQYGIVTIDGSENYSSDPNGIECDNDGSGSSNTPFTHPVLSNLTIVGTIDGGIAGGGNPTGSLYNAARFRRNTQYTLVNSIAYGYPTGIWNNTAQSSSSITIANNVVASVTANREYVGFSSTPPATGNIASAVNSITLDSPWGNPYTTDALKPTGGAAIDGNYYTHTDPFFDNTQYKGAIDKTGSSWLADAEFDGWVIN
ncbi:hypothetical protein ED312_11550 [Sinomicrobium pectinilyticum]|uniref:T9SS C-terminal target domain-containing protein n=1 Tax=Sinomicrobium pectinilyticum TaxID=1084421 RepID=A0A3N0EEF9_SINP1|nr:hypothetical protein [Sinomicrobium pectinilyticum]RNL86268.1 hypothetical protein ED312_11550 [Sinomicrobium pectinilyticum]